MSKQASYTRTVGGANALAETALFASRQAWLAGLGAASISRQWAREEAGNTFRTLVRQGSAVERSAIRVLGDRVESSITIATSLWRSARATALATANRLAETAASVMPAVRIPVLAAKSAAPKRHRPAKARAVKPVRASASVRRGKRSGRKSK